MTILYLDEWRLHPKAIPDLKTTNQSFIKLALKYKAMGVKNWFFILALHNPALQGVDPFSPNLTTEQMNMISVEARTNLWYFIREIARFQDIGSNQPFRFAANRGNIALLWLFLNHITMFLTQPRQTGKSGSVDCLTVWIVDIAGLNSKMLMITKDAALQVDQVGRLKTIRDLLPKYLYNRSPADSDNKTGINNTALNNEYKTAVARQNVMQANNLGRGMTVPIVHIDEVPFIAHIGVTLPAALKAGNYARDRAKLNGGLYGTILTSTAGKKDDRDGSYVYNDIISVAFAWDETVFDCRDNADLIDMIDKNSRFARSGRKGVAMRVVDITMSHRQLGYTDEWLLEKIRESGGSKEDNERDYLNHWTSGSQRSPFNTDVTKTLRDSQREPIIKEVTRDNYLIRWYISSKELELIRQHSKIIMGLDSSDAVGRDAIALVLTDISTLSVVAVATIRLANIIDVCNWITDFMIEHPEVIMVPEAKSTARTIIDQLLITLPARGIDPFKRIYNTLVNNAHMSEKDEEAFREIRGSLHNRDSEFYTERKAKFGFNTNSHLRDLLYGTIMQQAANEAGDSVHDKTLIDELLGLSVKNDRIDHSHTGHDDHVFAWLLTHWFARLAMNLSFYGIPSGMAMSLMKPKEVKQKSVLDVWAEERQQQRMKEIDELIDALENTQNDALAALYESKLQMLSRKVEASGVEANFSADELLNRVRKERANKMKLRQGGGALDEDQQLYSEIQEHIHKQQLSYFRGRDSQWGAGFRTF